MTLKVDVLNLLKEHKRLRPSEIRKFLLPQYGKKYDSTRSFDVIINRVLSKLCGLEKDGPVKRIDEGHQRVYYALKKDAKHKVEKVLFENEISSAISRGKLHQIQIKPDRLKKVDEFIISQLRPSMLLKAHRKISEPAEQKQEKRIPLFSLAELFKKTFKPVETGGLGSFLVELVSTQMEEEKKTRFFLNWLRDHTRISIACSLGETPPILTDKDLWMLLQILAPKVLDVNKAQLRKNPFHLIISFPAGL